jgi:hypothetical protein
MFDVEGRSGTVIMQHKSTLAWMGVPLLIWAVYQCWSVGYQRGYAAGHHDGWDTARRNFAPLLAKAADALERGQGSRDTPSTDPAD